MLNKTVQRLVVQLLFINLIISKEEVCISVSNMMWPAVIAASLLLCSGLVNGKKDKEFSEKAEIWSSEFLGVKSIEFCFTELFVL